ncbi:MAG: extracellular solute-binding protein [Chloroflexi bacterium]|nr:extracellular solute-binding protein [Chloroflexota bacterium]
MRHGMAFFLTALVVLLPLAACTQPAIAPAPAAPAAKAPAPAQTRNAWDNLVEAAGREGSVLVYNAGVGEASDQASKAFAAKYGVGLSFITGRGSELAQKITMERAAGLYVVDAMIMGLGTFYNSINPMKITVPLEPLLILPEVKDNSKWRSGKPIFADQAKTAIALSLNSLTYTAVNTEAVKDGEITSTEDVLNPKWKGKIVINDPSIAGIGAEWFTFIMLQAYSREKGEDYIRRLIRQEPVMNRDQRLQAEWVARGRYPIGLGIEPAEVDKMARAGAPIKPLAMKEGQPLTSGPWNLMIFDRAPHPKAAQLLANWLSSREGGEIVAKYSGYISARLDVPTTGFDPVFVPGDKDILPGEDYKLEQGKLLRVAADLFKELNK